MPKPLNGRDRRDKVLLQRPVSTAGEFNEPTEDEPEALGEAFARVRSITGQELSRGNTFAAEADYEVNLGTSATTSSLKTTDLIVWKGRTLGIVHVDITRMHLGEVICLCEERE